MRIISEKLVDAGDMSETSLSGSLAIPHIGMVAVQYVATGAPVGTLVVQASNDGTNWSDIAGASASISAAGNGMFNFITTAYSYIKVVYTKGSGTGALSVIANGKGF